MFKQCYYEHALKQTPDTIQIIFDIDSEQLQFRHAPFGTPLMVVSDTLELKAECDSKVILSTGSMIIKLTRELAGMVNSYYASESNITDEDKVLYMVLHTDGETEFVVRHSAFSNMEGLVVRAQDVFFYEENIMESLTDYVDFILKGRKQFLINEIRKDLGEGEFEIAVFDSMSNKFSRGWNPTAEVQFAISRTVDHPDLKYVLNDITDVQVIKK